MAFTRSLDRGELLTQHCKRVLENMFPELSFAVALYQHTEHFNYQILFNITDLGFINPTTVVLKYELEDETLHNGSYKLPDEVIATCMLLNS